MKSATPLLTRTALMGPAPAPPPRKLESGFRLAAQHDREEAADSFLEGFGEETTPVDQVLPHLVAVTASRDDALDDAPFFHDDAPTIAMPVDVSAILSILAAKGLASPLGDAPPEPPPSQPPSSLIPPLALRADYERAPAPTIRVLQTPDLVALARPAPALYVPSSPPAPRAPRRLELELTVVALVSFGLTLVAGAAVARALGAPLLGH